MDSKKIEELLSKYWNCETSLEEEQALRAYFKTAQVPDQLKETASLFQYFEMEKSKSLSDITFDKNVVQQATAKRSKTVSLFYKSMRIAAGISVLFVAVWFVRTEIRKTTPQEMVDTYDDPKLAFEETKKALLMISKSFGTAEQQAKKINLFNEAQQEISRKEKETKL